MYCGAQAAAEPTRINLAVHRCSLSHRTAHLDGDTAKKSWVIVFACYRYCTQSIVNYRHVA